MLVGGWTDGCVGRCMDGFTGGWGGDGVVVGLWMDGCGAGGWMDLQVGREAMGWWWVGLWMDGCVGRCMDGFTGG